VLLDEATDIDLQKKEIRLASGAALPYDTLVVASGAGQTYFGHDEWAPFAPPLKTLEDATTVRANILHAFELAEAAANEDDRRRFLTSVIVGGGPTGVELAGAMGELAQHTLRGDFRSFDSRSARILLVENSDRIMNSYHPDLAAHAAKVLTRLGITVVTGRTVTAVTENGVTLKSNDGKEEHVPAATVIWAAGVKASPLGKILAQGAGIEPADRAGRAPVGPDLTLPGHPEVFVIGDLASVKGRDGKPLRGTADVAQQEGTYVGKAVRARLAGRQMKPFKFFDLGTLAVIGRSYAVAEMRFIRLKGFPAWWVWLFLHILKLVSFENKLSVFLQWGYSFVTRQRSARLITRSGGR
jgi:NADH dehydrogenase